LIQLGFDMDASHPDFAERRAFLLDIYQHNIARHTRLFAGMEDILTHCQNNNIAWGIVTNKPSWLTHPLLQAMDLAQRAGCVVSGDTCENSKPHPQPLLHACGLLQVAAADCLYVGDAERDITAARQAGMPSAAALWGYLDMHDNPHDWQPDFIFAAPADLSVHIKQITQTALI
jgi:phosphoglycolate phosphatase